MIILAALIGLLLMIIVAKLTIRHDRRDMNELCKLDNKAYLSAYVANYSHQEYP